MTIFTEDGDIFFLDNKHAVYAGLDEEFLALMENEGGGNFFDELTQTINNVGSFEDLRPLNEADSVQQEFFNGIPCTSYCFFGRNGTTKVYMDGVKLVGIQRLSALGVSQEAVMFSSVSAVLPALMFNFKTTYLEIPDFFTFMAIAFSKMMGAEGISEADIQALIDEVRASQ